MTTDGPAPSLEGMSLEELWRLFPIILSPPDPAWRGWYQEEAASLRAGFAGPIHRLSHIGSTSVPGLLAKPTVDLLLETDDTRQADAIVDELIGLGWTLMACSEDPAFRIDLNKGYTPQGFADRVFHLHVVRPGDNDELYFRDWLRDHPETCAEYESLKRGLMARFKHDRDAYTEGKTSFIQAVTGRARTAYAGRYDR